MTDRNLIFRADMVRALLEGRKTQDRRVYQYDDERWGTILHCAVGDRIWVREGWSGDYVFRDTPPKSRKSFVADGHPYLRETIWYWADGNPEDGNYEKPVNARLMPWWASRLTLIVTGVRVQRLQDISEEDARAEGVNLARADGRLDPTFRLAFSNLWNSLYGPDAWDANPWVTAITFTVHHGNIDQMRAA
jgi:hypothetical protein